MTICHMVKNLGVWWNVLSADIEGVRMDVHCVCMCLKAWIKLKMKINCFRIVYNW